jgi:4-hydroxybenzoate polyprenyltransferase
MIKILYIFLFLNTILNCNSFLINNINKNKSLIQQTKIYQQQVNFLVLKNDKINSYKKLLRTTNVLTTFLLNILGGWLTMPSYKLFLNKKFWVFSLITQLTMMNSMVINDLFDLKIDLINNNNRPLVTKDITIKEARCLYISINFINTVLSCYFFNKDNFHIYIHCINLILFLYTPVFKKILLIKNVTCASVVASTLILTSKSILNNQIHQPHIELISVTSKFLFLSSFYIELLLDIKDINGDKENNIITIPNYFGVERTIDLLLFTFIFNITYFGSIFYKNNKYILLSGFLISNINFLKNLISLRRKNGKIDQNDNIVKYVKDTTNSLIVFIITIVFSL